MTRTAISTEVPGLSISADPSAIARIPASLLALIILTQFPISLTLTLTAPLLADMAADLLDPGTSPFLIKLISGIVGPAMIIGSPLAGWLADRFDRRPLLVAFGTLFILSATAPAFLDGIMPILVARFIAGFSGGALATIGMAMVGQYFRPDRQGSIIGTITFLSLISSILILPIAGVLASSGWRHAFLIFPAMLPLVVLALLRPLPAPIRQGVAGNGAEPQIPRGNLGLPRMPAALLLIAVAMGLALSLPGILYSFYFAEIGVTDVGTISLFLMYQATVGGVATLLFGRASARLSSTTIFVVCFACTALGLGIQGLTTDHWMAGAALTLTGISMGWLVPNLYATTIALVDERHHGAAIGIVQALSALATLLGISDSLETALGTQGIFLAIAAASALLMLGLLSRLLPLRKLPPS